MMRLHVSSRIPGLTPSGAELSNTLPWLAQNAGRGSQECQGFVFVPRGVGEDRLHSWQVNLVVLHVATTKSTPHERLRIVNGKRAILVEQDELS